MHCITPPHDNMTDDPPLSRSAIPLRSASCRAKHNNKQLTMNSSTTPYRFKQLAHKISTSLMLTGGTAYTEQNPSISSPPPPPTVHLLLILPPHAPINHLDIVLARIALPADPVAVVRVRMELDNGSKGVALMSTAAPSSRFPLPCRRREALTCSRPNSGQGVDKVITSLTFESFILNPSGTNGFKLTILAPSLRSRNISVRSRLSDEGNTSLLTSCW